MLGKSGKEQMPANMGVEISMIVVGAPQYMLVRTNLVLTELLSNTWIATEQTSTTRQDGTHSMPPMLGLFLAWL